MPHPVPSSRWLTSIGGVGLRLCSGSVLFAGWCAVLVLSSGLSISAADVLDWPQWRGPGRAGVWSSVRLPRRLGPGAVEKLWSTKVGGGFSGVVVAGDRVLTMDRGGSGEEERVLCLNRNGRLPPLDPQLSGALRGPGLGQGSPGHPRRRGRGGLYPGSRRQGRLPPPLGRQAALEPGSSDTLRRETTCLGTLRLASGRWGPGLPAGRREGRRQRGGPGPPDRQGTLARPGGPSRILLSGHGQGRINRAVAGVDGRSAGGSRPADRKGNLGGALPNQQLRRGHHLTGVRRQPVVRLGLLGRRPGLQPAARSRSRGAVAVAQVELPDVDTALVRRPPLRSGQAGRAAVHPLAQWEVGLVRRAPSHPQGAEPPRYVGMGREGRIPAQEAGGAAVAVNAVGELVLLNLTPEEVRRPGAGQDHRSGRRASLGPPGLFGSRGLRSQPKGAGQCPNIALTGGGRCANRSCTALPTTATHREGSLLWYRIPGEATPATDRHGRTREPPVELM